MKASDLHEAAEERIKTVFRRKRQAEETDVDEEETDADGLKILSSRFQHL